jgi:hypothetical protein
MELRSLCFLQVKHVSSSPTLPHLCLLQKKCCFLYCPDTGWAAGAEGSDLEGWAFPFPGVTLIQDFVTPEEEAEMVRLMDCDPWKLSQSGRKKQVRWPELSRGMVPLPVAPATSCSHTLGIFGHSGCGLPHQAWLPRLCAAVSAAVSLVRGCQALGWISILCAARGCRASPVSIVTLTPHLYVSPSIFSLPRYLSLATM